MLAFGGKLDRSRGIGLVVFVQRGFCCFGGTGLMIGRLFLLLSLAEFVGLGDVWVERLVGCFAEFGGGGHFFFC